MARLLRVLEFGTTFEVIYVGEVSNDYRIETMEEVERRLGSSFTRRLLIDYTSAWAAPEAAPEIGARRYQERFAEMRHLRGARVAFLNAPLAHAELPESARERIGCRVRRFYDRSMALEWLSESGS
jgi:hypothetical protein